MARYRQANQTCSFMPALLYSTEVQLHISELCSTFKGELMRSFRCSLQCEFNWILTSSQPNSSAQAASCSGPAPQPPTCCSGPNTRATHEPLPCLWRSTQPLPCLRCTTNPLSTRPTHERLQQQPGSLQCTPTDPLATSPRPTRCTQVWPPVMMCVCVYHGFFFLHCIFNVWSLTSHYPLSFKSHRRSFSLY